MLRTKSALWFFAQSKGRARTTRRTNTMLIGGSVIALSTQRQDSRSRKDRHFLNSYVSVVKIMNSSNFFLIAIQVYHTHLITLVSWHIVSKSSFGGLWGHGGLQTASDLNSVKIQIKQNSYGMQASSVAQLVRATGCSEDGHGFESRTGESFFSFLLFFC